MDPNEKKRYRKAHKMYRERYIEIPFAKQEPEIAYRRVRSPLSVKHI